ncbi:AAA family ATPase [Mycolicibacterium sp. S2-37]|nr:AAA family ATPase [Mycolicibacterium sp. S2-37]
MFDIDTTQTIIWGEGDDILWAEGEALMIAGGMGLGKTTLAGQLVRGLLGLESTVLGLPITPASKPILYLAMDRPRQIRRSFLRQFGDTDRLALEGKLIVRPGPPISDIASCPPLLAKMAESVGAGTIFVDSLKDAVVGLSEDATGGAYNRARQGCLAKGIQVLELHHNRKPSAESAGGISDVYGSTWLTSGAGSVIMLTGDPGDPVVKFRHAKQPANEVGPWRLLHDQERGVFEVQKIDLLVVVKNAGPNGVTARDAARAMYEKSNPTEAQIKKAQRQLDKLVREGDLTSLEGSRGGAGGSAPTTWFLRQPVSEFDSATGIQWEQATLT